MSYLIISSSLNKHSRSRVLARHAQTIFASFNRQADFIDLQDYDLPFCDGQDTLNHPQVLHLKSLIGRAKTLLLAAPVYNYGMNGALKNLFDLTTSAWQEKLVGLMLAGGGKASYMAGMSFLNSLMINARCLIIPRFVFALEGEIGASQIQSQEIERRLRELVETALRLSERLHSGTRV